MWVLLTFTAHVSVCITKERQTRESTPHSQTIKGFQENKQQSECFAAVAKNVLKLKNL